MAHITCLLPGEKTSVCGGARDQLMVLPVRGPLGFTFRSDDNHVRTFCLVHLPFPYAGWPAWSIISDVGGLLIICVRLLKDDKSTNSGVGWFCGFLVQRPLRW